MMLNSALYEDYAFSGPPELSGKERNDVKLVYGDRDSGDLSIYSNFGEIVNLLKKDDMIIFNDSLTIPSSLFGYLREQHVYGRIHIGQTLENGSILVEIRPKELNNRITDGEIFLHHESGVKFKLERRHNLFPRYFEARTLLTGNNVRNILNNYGRPIFYEGYTAPYPVKYYKNVFQTIPGSAEYPSASRPFTEDIVNRLKRKGVVMGTLTLHCNLGSLEREEYEHKNRLLEEAYKISPDLVKNIIEIRENGGRIIAVGTTVVRALISSVKNREMMNLSGKTHIKISGDSDIWPLDGIISGMHEPESSHLELLEAFGGTKLLSPIGLIAHKFNLKEHEFGDSMLIL